MSGSFHTVTTPLSKYGAVRTRLSQVQPGVKLYALVCTSVYVSRDQVDIVLIKKCKTTDILALNSAMGNIQKALQRYVGFDGMDHNYSDRIEDLMDRDQP